MIPAIRSVFTKRKLLSNTNFILKQKVHSIFPDVSVPNVNLGDYIWKNVYKWQNKTALVCAETNRSYTYLQLQRKTNALANFLHKFENLQKSDTLAIIMPNLPEYAIVLLGAIQAGYKVTTINPFFTPAEMSKLLTLSETKLVFTTTEMYSTSREALQLAKLHVPTITIQTKEGSLLPTGTINFNDILSESHNIQLSLQSHQEETIIIPFSSGTTGHPKGVELSHKNIVSCLHILTASTIDHLEETNDLEQEVVPLILPMYHIYGMVPVLMHGLLRGSKIVTLPKFKFQLFINVLEKYKPTMLYLVPPIFHMLLNSKEIKQKHLLPVKNIVSGAAPLGATDIMAFHDKVNGNVNVIQAYGLTETSGLSNLQSKNVKNGKKSGGVGHLIPLTEGKIVSLEDGTELKTNERGELWLRGPQILKGYYKNEKASKEVLTDDKWFKTGDVGYYDEDGHFFITDRIKDLIKVKGFQVAPAELEELLREHPDIEDTAVVGVPHDRYGEVPKAFVVRKSGSTVTSSEIEEFVKTKVVNYKQLTGGVFFIDSIPKTPSGKILKRQL